MGNVRYISEHNQKGLNLKKMRILVERILATEKHRNLEQMFRVCGFLNQKIIFNDLRERYVIKKNLIA